ncbi:MAG: ethanolamine ammonia-lyase subunit EutB, partial [Gammaproteobacteria bacterium]
MPYGSNAAGTHYDYAHLRLLLERASPGRAGDRLAGLAADTAEERVAARMALADLPLRRFLDDPIVPYETDEVTRLILDGHDRQAFAPIAAMTAGDFRDFLLSDEATAETLADLAPGIAPEMAAAVSKLMRNQDLIAVAKKISVVTRFRTTIGLPGCLCVRIQPNHPSDDLAGIGASILDGLMYGCGDACIGINPASDSANQALALLERIEELRLRFEIPVQSCVLAHVSTTIDVMERGGPVDLVFQSIAGSEAANRAFGVNLALLDEANSAVQGLHRAPPGANLMYFETGQGAALSAQAHHGVDQQTMEARAYAVARRYAPLLVNTVVGFIGPEYL